MLKLQAGHVRHLQIDDHAFGKTGRQVEEKVARGSEALHIIRDVSSSRTKAFLTESSSSTTAIRYFDVCIQSTFMCPARE